MTVVAATRNPGKAREFSRILSPLGFTVKSLDELGVSGEPEETGSTFLENARIKAAAAVAATGFPSVADDSGICVDALGGAPGVRSARFAEPGKRTETLLALLEGHTDRSARFVASVVLLYPDGREITAEGICEGEIAPAPCGDGGFGYDPVFFLPELGRTMAELTPDEKDGVSHRGKALRALLAKLS
ncbi:MAG: RdgB/HAM1 family non-canonical purine NTP pyrophosphatase [Oscillospiraceae bacterium]|jgi:XTP/dITP diphosphohydrolase|nr:RdgB/HAM1 family non-canonical purine NTP pyrophosphatase [Oscillospiraceae bacterium]